MKPKMEELAPIASPMETIAVKAKPEAENPAFYQAVCCAD